MKNNDFDFIKAKFEDSQPDIPDSLSKEALKNKASFFFYFLSKTLIKCQPN